MQGCLSLWNRKSLCAQKELMKLNEMQQVVHVVLRTVMPHIVVRILISRFCEFWTLGKNPIFKIIYIYKITYSRNWNTHESAKMKHSLNLIFVNIYCFTVIGNLFTNPKSSNFIKLNLVFQGGLMVVKYWKCW